MCQVVRRLRNGDFVRVKVCHLETTQPKVRGSRRGPTSPQKTASRCVPNPAVTMLRVLMCPCSAPLSEVWGPAITATTVKLVFPHLEPQTLKYDQTRRHDALTLPQVLTLKLDLNYWPTWELTLDAGSCTWSRHLLPQLAAE